MTETQIAELIATLKSQIDGELIDRGRVTDHLLDIRLGSDRPGLVAAVDALLADLPGRSVVETSWWAEALDHLGAQAAGLPA